MVLCLQQLLRFCFVLEHLGIIRYSSQLLHHHSSLLLSTVADILNGDVGATDGVCVIIRWLCPTILASAVETPSFIPSLICKLMSDADIPCFILNVGFVSPFMFSRVHPRLPSFAVIFFTGVGELSRDGICV